MTTILKHANATGWKRKDAKYMNNRAADPAEKQIQEHDPLSRLPDFPHRSLIRLKRKTVGRKRIPCLDRAHLSTKELQVVVQNHPHPGKGEKLKEKAEHAINEARTPTALPGQGPQTPPNRPNDSP